MYGTYGATFSKRSGFPGIRFAPSGLRWLAAYLLLLAAFLWSGVRCLVRTGAPWLFALAVAWAVGSLTNVFLWDYRFFAPFAPMLTCALACLVDREDG